VRGETKKMNDPTAENTENVSPLLKSRWFWSVAIMVVIILGGAWILFSQSISRISPVGGDAAVILEPAPIAGHPAPDFELATLDGELLRLSDFAGKPILVNFWATWCGPCRAEFPDFQKAWLESEDNLVIIAINHTTADRAEQVDDFVAEMGVTFPIVLDKDGQAAEAYQVRGLPTSIFIDSNGRVIEVFTGPINQAYIESKLGEF
jgi:peroxiredoxin